MNHAFGSNSETTGARLSRSPRQSQFFVDPFAVKISIPPLVLLVYVIWKSSFSEDRRIQYIREAEENHRVFLASEEIEREAFESLSKHTAE